MANSEDDSWVGIRNTTTVPSQSALLNGHIAPEPLALVVIAILLLTVLATGHQLGLW
ncbi:hypothetical protein [Natrinema longum]|uniref:Uncharacterized protein n=1 Tax=Natrinema longum TaxID=370324 RepID=A0A8A2UAE9_9EURY|nr:hypothetical protein [Natrinema longum]MBZ6496417.1 hypothetical protein [Natrinema longum]QSW85676.1 hypothetical protein J0X27_02195 [Natrinema longum]